MGEKNEGRGNYAFIHSHSLFRKKIYLHSQISSSLPNHCCSHCYCCEWSGMRSFACDIDIVG